MADEISTEVDVGVWAEFQAQSTAETENHHEPEEKAQWECFQTSETDYAFRQSGRS